MQKNKIFLSIKKIAYKTISFLANINTLKKYKNQFYAILRGLGHTRLHEVE